MSASTLGAAQRWRGSIPRQAPLAGISAPSNDRQPLPSDGRCSRSGRLSGEIGSMRNCVSVVEQDAIKGAYTANMSAII